MLWCIQGRGVNMTFNQLLYFQTVSKYENYHKAAEKLYLSQPSLSRAISSLEKELGVMLFEKQGRGIVLLRPADCFKNIRTVFYPNAKLLKLK